MIDTGKTYTFEGRDITTLSRDELLEAYRFLADTLDQERTMVEHDHELNRLLRLRIRARRLIP